MTSEISVSKLNPNTLFVGIELFFQRDYFAMVEKLP